MKVIEKLSYPLLMFIICTIAPLQVKAEPLTLNEIEKQILLKEQNGNVSFKWDDGSLMAKGTVVNGKKQGHWVYYYKGTDGTKKLFEGGYSQGLKTDRWSHFDENGALLAQNTYSKNMLNGSCITYYTSGKFHTEIDYNMGLMNGRYREYYEDGNPKEISWYSNGKKEGQVNLYYPNGKKQAIGNCSKGIKTGKWTFYHDNGTVEAQGNYARDQKTGLWTYSDEKGIKHTEHH